jgi:methylaspartate ammonia-lyase
MTENINKVLEFHKTTGMETRTKPGFLSNDRISLRINLLQEELAELEEAAYKRDIVEVLDALCDLQYILHGAVLDFGLKEAFEEACAEVHESNMSKFCNSTWEAQQSCKRYQFKGIETYYRLVNGKHIILRSSDDKILKGIRFFEPRLKEIIDNLKKKLKNEDNQEAAQ